MRSFKQFLLLEGEHQFLTDKEEIMDWIEASNIGPYGSKLKDYEFDTEGRVRTSGDLLLLGDYAAKENEYRLPVQFAKCHHCEIRRLQVLNGVPEDVVNLTMISNYFRKLIGIPQRVRGVFNFDHDGFLDAIDDFPKTIQMNGNLNMAVNFQASRLKSLSGIHKHCKEINGGAYFGGYELTEAFLGLLKISGVSHYVQTHKSKDMEDMKSAYEIINKHYKVDGSGDIIECKEDLMTNNLKSYAKL